MKKLDLSNQNLTKLTESDLISFCELNNIKPEKLEILNLYRNELIDLNFIIENTNFINLKRLYIGWNKITNINNIRYLKNLEELNINYLNLNNEIETINLINNIKNIKTLICINTFKKFNRKQLIKSIPNIKII